MAKLILLLIFMLPNLLLDAQVVGTHASGARQKTFFEQAFTIGGANEERSRRIITLSDGGYLIVGGTQSDGAGDFDALLVKLKPNGQIDWAKTIGGTDWDYFKGAIEAGGAIYAYGETYSGDLRWCQQ